MTKSSKIKPERLDQALLNRGLVESRNKAKALILAGRVCLNGEKALKADQAVKERDQITLPESPESRYVSRGGLKLEGALAHFGTLLYPSPLMGEGKVRGNMLQGVIAVDIGASTGGFTDCLLQHGAKLVYAVDVGKSQIAARLRKDPRVKLIEHTNARHLNPEIFNPKPSLAAVDVSFISLKKVLPTLVPCLAQPFQILALVKPQFECQRGETKKGIVKDPAVRERVLREMKDFCLETLGLEVKGTLESPLPGAKGNLESFILLC